jgi:sarcosine oxidase subunit alpha
MTSYRLESGGLVDRQSRISFTFDGKRMLGLAGDSLAPAQPNPMP